MTIPTLENQRVRLAPLELSNYKHLIPIGKQDKLVQFSPTKIDTPEDLKAYVQTALEQHKQQTALPFIIFDKQKNAFAGCTRYMNINWTNKVLEIGSTWIGKEFQGTELNKNMKFLMLRYAFETLGFEKVEFRVDERNLASRKAVEKLGCKLEGVLRKNVYLLDGFKRNTCCYGLLLEEWNEIKETVFEGF
ncbi:GNAT family N-acetyltransferase [Sabulilitoribacter multivorans]|uniref:GNAT family N-acetyltransferase n=1 Tax=Flaviramulus multivorans TaxID=1304750 RepID=A0ABS9IGX8_9FLAO|nr:GNAT family protein [Flaviramulus multivorans]MCF7560021.1 GNAT family N-acetyltransferase [Flaviramulus multivorans]